MVKDLYPSVTEEHIENLRPALCKFSIELPKVIQKEIHTIVREFLTLKKSFYPDWEKSVLNCLDFHYSSQTLKIIEANTNASGYLITHLLPQKKEKVKSYEKSIYKSFISAFDSKRPEPLFIIDENPEKEKMYPEFLMFKDMFMRMGLERVKIVKTQDLSLNENAFVYNRDTDFYFKKNPEILKAFQSGILKLSTSPTTYERLASKKNDLKGEKIKAFPHLEKALLKSFPFTKDLWEKRKRFFFKPQEMFGGKGVYSGKSLSRKKFESLDDNYIVQEAHPPGKIEFKGEEWKYDIRAFFSESEVQKIVARVYQGQVTNFSKKGGGFALIKWV